MQIFLANLSLALITALFCTSRVVGHRFNKILILEKPKLDQNQLTSATVDDERRIQKSWLLQVMKKKPTYEESNKKISSVTNVSMQKKLREHSLESSSSLNATSKTRPSRTKQNYRTITALMILAITFGFGGAAILVVCLVHKYCAKRNGYILMKKRFKESSTDDDYGKTTDYASAYSIPKIVSDDSIFVADDVNSFNQDILRNSGDKHTQLSGESGDQSHDKLKEIEVDMGNKRCSHNNETSQWEIINNNIEQTTSSDYTDCERINLDHCKSLEKINSSKPNSKLRRYTQWSTYIQNEGILEDQLKNSGKQRISRVESRSDSFPVGKCSKESLDNCAVILDQSLTKSDKETASGPSVYSRKQLASNHSIKVDDVLSKEPFGPTNDSYLSGWNSKKRHSIQAKVYLSPSDSDEEYELSRKLCKCNEENNECAFADCRETMSDTIIYFNYECNSEKRKCKKLAHGGHSDNTKAKRKGKTKTKSNIKIVKKDITDNGSAMYQAALEGIQQQVGETSESFLSCCSLPSEFSMTIKDDTVAEEIIEEVMLNISSSIFDNRNGRVLFRSISDSKLIRDRKIEASTSCLSLKSFSTSNLRSIHIMPMLRLDNQKDKQIKSSPAKIKPKKSRFKKIQKLFRRKKRKA